MLNGDPYEFYRYRQLSINEEVITRQKLRKRLNILKKWADSFESFYPREGYKRGAYWNFKIPILENIVRGKDVTFETRRECVQYLVDAMVHIVNAKKRYGVKERSKVMCLISLTDMFSSEVTVFIDKDYYNQFFNRDDEDHSLKPMESGKRSLMREYGIRVPEGMGERGYVEVIDDGDRKHRGELWAIGELGEW